MIITIDCGTTNSRYRLYDGLKMIDELKCKAGVRNTAFDGNANYLRATIKQSIDEILHKNQLSPQDIEVVISSGTLTSDVGIYTIPHVLAPANIEKSARHSKLVTLNDITEIPMFFIPGVKTLPDENETDEDIIITKLESMSGEECETYGIMEMLGIEGDFVITLPGSYVKTLDVNKNGEIISFRTGMCGELIAAISEHTLLRHSLPVPVIKNIIPEKLFRGFDYCAKHGVSPTLIKTRMVRILRDWTEDEAANFFVGAALLDDIRITKETCRAGRPLIVGGTNPLRTIFTLLLKHSGIDNIIEIDDEIAKIAPNIGAMKVYNTYLQNEKIKNI